MAASTFGLLAMTKISRPPRRWRWEISRSPARTKKAGQMPGMFHRRARAQPQSNIATFSSPFLLMFFSRAAGEAGPKLHSINLTGRNEQIIPTPDFASDPAWSPLLE